MQCRDVGKVLADALEDEGEDAAETINNRNNSVKPTWLINKKGKLKMKVAVTAVEENLEGQVDPRFGRAKYIIVVDTDTDDFKVHNNSVNLNAAQGAGIQTGRNIANLGGVEAVITGNVGPNAYKTLTVAGIKVFLSDKQSVAEAIESFKGGKLKEADNANVEGHWA